MKLFRQYRICLMLLLISSFAVADEIDSLLSRSGLRGGSGLEPNAYTLKLTDDSQVESGQLLGRTVVVAFWDSRDRLSKDQLKGIGDFAARFAKDGGQGTDSLFLALASEESAEAVTDATAMLDVPVPVAYDCSLRSSLGLPKATSLIVIDHQGRLRAYKLGPMDWANRDFAQAILALCKASGPRAAANPRPTVSPRPAPSQAPLISPKAELSQRLETSPRAEIVPRPEASPKPVQGLKPGLGYELNEGLSDDAFLGDFERAVAAELNKMRLNPAAYAKKLREYRSYFQGRNVVRPGKITLATNEGTAAVDEAIAALEAQKPLPALRVSGGMSRAAGDLARDQGKSGETGHTASDGSDPFKRMNRYGSWQKTAGENVAYGNDNAEEVIFSLLIDDGVPSRGHRENLLNPRFTVVGLAYGKHPVWRSLCVMDLAAAYKEGN